MLQFLLWYKEPVRSFVSLSLSHPPLSGFIITRHNNQFYRYFPAYITLDFCTPKDRHASVSSFSRKQAFHIVLYHCCSLVHVQLSLQDLPLGRQGRADGDLDVLERRLVDLAHVIVHFVGHLVNYLWHCRGGVRVGGAEGVNQRKEGEAEGKGSLN